VQDSGNLGLGNLDSRHRPGCWLRRRKKRTAALLVKRASAAVSALWAVKAGSPGKTWMRVTKTPRVSAALPLQGWPSMAAVFTALRSPVLLVFSLAAAPSHQSPLFIFVRKSSPQGNVGCCPLLSIWGLPTNTSWLHCTYTSPDCSAHGGQPEGSFCRRTQACWTRGGVQALSQTVRHQSTGVGEKPVRASSHPLCLHCVHLRKAGEGGIVGFQPRGVGRRQKVRRR